MKIVNVVGARPNFMKIAPIMREMRRDARFQPLLVHTGQHYDEKMSRLFFDELDIPMPDVNLEVGSSSHAIQTADIMRRFEPFLLREKPDAVLVVGDVNSTMACTLVAAKLDILVVHVEAGLRSFDRSMPEEINRIVTDALSDLLFTTEKSAEANLRHEGVDTSKIFFVGNVMIDTLFAHLEKSRNSPMLHQLGLTRGGTAHPRDAEVDEYAILTLHRPSNISDRQHLSEILEALHVVAKHIPMIFPIHPRTRAMLHEYGLESLVHFDFLNGTVTPPTSQGGKGIFLTEPLGYLDFLHVMAHAKLVFTDSGGMQEETTVLGIPCLTLRENTERPVTVEEGTNVIVGTDRERIIAESLKVLNGHPRTNGRRPDLWDGKAAGRIVTILSEQLQRG